ncbi:MAG: hypothetical protein JWO48_2409 [Bryobacterales bacterium]|jgi:hypothetical protein|nr:hypothetical protein [Bryobacterales bacterium]
MKRFLLTVAALALMAAGITGCHASGSVDPHGSTQVTSAR